MTRLADDQISKKDLSATMYRTVLELCDPWLSIVLFLSSVFGWAYSCYAPFGCESGSISVFCINLRITRSEFNWSIDLTREFMCQRVGDKHKRTCESSSLPAADQNRADLVAAVVLSPSALLGPLYLWSFYLADRPLAGVLWLCVSSLLPHPPVLPPVQEKKKK